MNGGMTKRKHIGAVIVAAVLMLLTLGSWALSSPVGASPDEDFHLASIWCGQGEREGLCAPGSEADTRMIPDNIERAICYSHEQDIGGVCQGADFNDGQFGLVESDRVNGDGLYPSGYYYLTSFFASENMVVSVVALRLVLATLFTALAAGLWLLLPRANRAAFATGVIATFVPFGLFLIPSINPSGWAIASTALLFPSLVAFLSAQGRRRWAFAGYAVVAAGLGLSARGDSAAYTAVAALAALVMAYEHRREFWLRAILPIVMIVASAAAFLSADQTGSALGGGMAIEGAQQESLRGLLFENFLALPELFVGILGQNFDNSPYTGLGWLDTPLPAIVWVSTTFVCAAVLFAGFARWNLRKAIAVGGVALSLIAIPTLLLTQNAVRVGYQVQPRYIMPMLVLLVIVALTPTAGKPLRNVTFSLPQAVTFAVLLSVANGFALYTNLRRYVNPGSYDLESGEWWWAAGPSPSVVLIVGTLAFAALTGVFAWAAVRADREEQAAHADEAELPGQPEQSGQPGQQDDQLESQPTKR